jgi:DNA-directed RNA polymerase specialized sigma24 family protein
VDAAHEAFYRTAFTVYVVYAMRSFGLRAEVAAEVVQEVFGRLFSGKYAVQNVQAWVTKLVMRESLLARQREAGPAVPFDEALGPASPDPSLHLVHTLFLETGLGDLETQDRELLRRHYYEGFTMREIAAQRGISEAYAERLRGIAVSRLRARLGVKPGDRP